jgi:hypothetical protein
MQLDQTIQKFTSFPQFKKKKSCFSSREIEIFAIFPLTTCQANIIERNTILILFYEVQRRLCLLFLLLMILLCVGRLAGPGGAKHNRFSITLQNYITASLLLLRQQKGSLQTNILVLFKN